MTTPMPQVVSYVQSLLAEAGMSDPGNDAQAIVHAAVRDSVPAAVQARARAMAAARASGMPLAYVTGRVDFMGVELVSAPGALIPRAETELVGTMTLEALKALPTDREIRLIDMCCGSGNLVSALAVTVPHVRAWASDLTEESLRVARANVEHLGLQNRVEILQSDLFAALCGRGLEGTIDVIVCNPPYISSTKLGRESADLLVHEPQAAFDGGPYGVSIFQRVVRDALPFLTETGTLLFEIGAGQERAVSSLFTRSGQYGPLILGRNAEGVVRVVGASRKQD